MNQYAILPALILSLATSYSFAEPDEAEKAGLVWQMWGAPNDWPTPESACEDWSTQFTHLDITDVSITNYTFHNSFWYANCRVLTAIGRPDYHNVSITSAPKKYYLDIPQDDNVLGSCIGNPIDVTTGNKHQVENLLTIESLHPISLNLYFNSSRPEKWRHSYSKSVVRINDLQNVKNGLFPKICGNNQLHESSGGFSSHISRSSWSRTNNFVFAGESHTAPPQIVQYSAESACIANWNAVSSRYHYSWVNGSTAEYDGNHRCNILDSSGVKRLTLNIYQTGGHLARATTFECTDIDPTVPPALDSAVPIHVRFTRGDGSLVSFSYNTITAELENKSQTGERAEFILSGAEITGYRFYSNLDEVEEYDSDGRLLSITSLDGHEQTLSYFTDLTTGQVLLERVENETGESIEFSYELAGEIHQFNRIKSISDHIGLTWSFVYAPGDDPDTKEGNLTFINSPDGTSRQYHYEDVEYPEYLTGITDERENRYASWTYNSEGKADSSAHGINKEVELLNVSYNEDINSHNVTKKRKSGIDDQVTDITFAYDTHSTSRFKALAKITGPDGGDDLINEHDPETGYLLYKIEHGKRTDYGDYDNKGNPGYVIEAAGSAEERRTDYTYDTRFHSKVATINEASVYSSGSKVTTYTYDDYGNATSINISGYRPDGTTVSRTTSMQYQGPFHQLSEIDGPRTDVSDVYYFDYYMNSASAGNNQARLKSVRTYSGLYLRNDIQYTATGKILSENRLNGLQILYSYYNGSDRLKSVRMTDSFTGKVKLINYDYLATGEISAITRGYNSNNPVRLEFGYDDARRLTTVTDAHGNYIEYVLDSEGNVNEENVYDSSGSLKKSLSQTFDNYNHLKTSLQLNENRTINFNPDGTIDSVTDGNEVLTEYSYDGLKRMVAMTRDAGGQNSYTANTVTQYIYDSHDNLATVISANSAETQYEYDDLGNIISITSPDTGTTRYEHDSAGNIVSLLDAKNQVFNYTYDALNRLQQIESQYQRENTYYTYDNCAQGQGLVCSVQRGNGTLNYKYNAFSDVTEISQSLTTVDSFNTAENTVAYAYNTNSDISSIGYPSGAVVHYSYNSAGKVDNFYLEQDGQVRSLSLNISYLPFGEELIQTYGNGINVMGFYDTAYRLFITGDPDNFFEHISAYDGNGNITGLTTLFDNNYIMSQFEYDRLDRISSASGFHGGSGYFYDKVGNKQLQAESGSFFAASYDAQSNRLNTLGGEEINIDENGNLLNLRGMTLSYTTDNRLKSVNTDVRFEYNGLGQRMMKRSVAPGVAGSYGFVRTSGFIYGANAQLLAEVGPTGRVTKEYIYLNDTPLAMLIHSPSSPGAIYKADLDSDGEISAEDAFIWYYNHRTDPAYDVTGDGVTDSQDISRVLDCGLSQAVCATENYSTEIYYIHNDHLGTPKLLTDSNQNTVWRARSTPFGKAFVDNDVDGDGVEIEFNLRQPGQYYDKESGLYYNYYRYYDPETGRYITSDPIGLAGGVNTYLYANANPLKYIDPTGEIGIVGAVVGGVSSAVGTLATGGSYQEAAVNGAIGALTGALPGAGTLVGSVIQSAGVGAVGNALGQGIQIAKDDCKTSADFNVGSVIGSAIGGALTGGRAFPHGNSAAVQVGIAPSNAIISATAGAVGTSLGASEGR